MAKEPNSARDFVDQLKTIENIFRLTFDQSTILHYLLGHFEVAQKSGNIEGLKSYIYLQIPNIEPDALDQLFNKGVLVSAGSTWNFGKKVRDFPILLGLQNPSMDAQDNIIFAALLQKMRLGIGPIRMDRFDIQSFCKEYGTTLGDLLEVLFRLDERDSIRWTIKEGEYLIELKQ